jgi:hypothetical protein
MMIPIKSHEIYISIQVTRIGRFFGFIRVIVLIKHHLSLNGDQHELLSYPH